MNVSCALFDGIYPETLQTSPIIYRPRSRTLLANGRVLVPNQSFVWLNTLLSGYSIFTCIIEEVWVADWKTKKNKTAFCVSQIDQNTSCSNTADVDKLFLMTFGTLPAIQLILNCQSSASCADGRRLITHSHTWIIHAPLSKCLHGRLFPGYLWGSVSESLFTARFLTSVPVKHR